MKCVAMRKKILGISCALFFSAGLSVSAADSVAEAYKLYQAKRYKEAARMFDSVMLTAKPDGTVSYYAAVCHQQAGNFPRAKFLYRQVVQLSPGSMIAGYAQGVLAKFDPSANMTAAAAAYNPLKSAKSEIESSVQGPDEARIYYSGSHGDISIPVLINNRAVTMDLDTGAPSIFIGKNQLERAGIRAPEGNATGMTGGATNAGTLLTWHMPATVQVGPFIVTNAVVTVASSNSADPLLGQEFLNHFDYTVDHGARCLLLRRKGLAGNTQRSGYSIPFTFKEFGKRVVVEAEINGRKAPLMMDTGNTAAGIAFTSLPQAERYGIIIPGDATDSVQGGVSGWGRVKVFYVNRVKVGPIDRAHVKVSVNMNTSDSGDDPLLGHEFFDGWQYNIDMKENKIYLLRR